MESLLRDPPAAARYVRVERWDGSSQSVLVPVGQPSQDAIRILAQYEQSTSRSAGTRYAWMMTSGERVNEICARAYV